jgi:AcrR family transcriptional regulator
MESSKTPRRSTPKRTSRLRKEERKQQLLQIAKKLFLDLGYQHTTTEKIAREAGVTEPVLYRHFKSKKALFLEVLQEIRKATLQRWHRGIEELGSPLEKLRRVVDLYLLSTQEHAVEFRIMHRTLVETDDPQIAEFLRSFYLDSQTFLERILEEGQRHNVVRKELVPAIVAWEFIRTALGYTLTRPLGIPLYEQPDYVPRAIDWLMSCLRV